MKLRTLRLIGTVAVALLLCLVFFALLSGSTAWAATPASAQELVQEGSERHENPTIVDLRRISIPFGIAGPHILQADGQIHAQGEATCDDDMISFEVRGVFTQTATGAIAESNYVSFDCVEQGNSPWDVTAEPQGQAAFEAGNPADLCVMANFYRSQGPVDEFEWCYLNVAVESQPVLFLPFIEP